MKLPNQRLNNLLWACHAIIADFHDYGPVIQADDKGEYGEHSDMGRLIKAVDQMEALLEGLKGS